jgi:hypothetical protein
MSIWLRWDDGTGSITPSYWSLDDHSRYSKSEFINIYGAEALQYATKNSSGKYSLIIGNNIICGTKVKEYELVGAFVRWKHWADRRGFSFLEVWLGNDAKEQDYTYCFSERTTQSMVNWPGDFEEFCFVPQRMLGKYSKKFINHMIVASQKDGNPFGAVGMFEKIAELNGWFTPNPQCLPEEDLERLLTNKSASLTNFLLADYRSKGYQEIPESCPAMQYLMQILSDYLGQPVQYVETQVYNSTEWKKLCRERGIPFDAKGVHNFFSGIGLKDLKGNGEYYVLIHEFLHSIFGLRFSTMERIDWEGFVDAVAKDVALKNGIEVLESPHYGESTLNFLSRVNMTVQEFARQYLANAYKHNGQEILWQSVFKN